MFIQNVCTDTIKCRVRSSFSSAICFALSVQGVDLRSHQGLRGEQGRVAVAQKPPGGFVLHRPFESFLCDCLHQHPTSLCLPNELFDFLLLPQIRNAAMLLRMTATAERAAKAVLAHPVSCLRVLVVQAAVLIALAGADPPRLQECQLAVAPVQLSRQDFVREQSRIGVLSALARVHSVLHVRLPETICIHECS